MQRSRLVFDLATASASFRAYAHYAPKAFLGLSHTIPGTMDDRAAGKPRSLTPDDRPGKKARLGSPPHLSPPRAEKTMAPEPLEMNQDIPVDPVDSLGAPAVVTAGGRSSTSRAAGGGTKKQAKKKKKIQALPEPCSPEDVLAKDVTLLLGQEAVDKAVEEGTEWESPFGMREEVELEITMMASNGAYYI